MLLTGFEPFGGDPVGAYLGVYVPEDHLLCSDVLADEAQQVVVGLAATVELHRGYLQALLVDTRKAIGAGTDIGAAPDAVAQSERSKWLLFDDYHGHNVTQAFRELEWE